MPKDRTIDGVNLLTALKRSDASAAQSPPKPLASRPLFWRDGGLRAVQVAQWKLIHSQKPNKDFLFNLTSDPTEKNNLAQTQTAKLAELKTLLAAHHRGMAEPLWPTFIEMPIFIDKTVDQAQSPDDEYTYWYN